MNRRRALSALVLAAALAATAVHAGDTVHPKMWPTAGSAIPADPEIEAAVDEILASLSVEEKVGQVIQASITHVQPEDVKKYRLGSVLNGGGGWPGDVREARPADWLALADAFWEASMDTSEGGHAIPVIWGSDAVHGHNNIVGATLFPHNVGLGATGDVSLLREIGRVTALEMSATGIDWNFSPTVAVARDGRWGRAYESWSEDPDLVRAYAAAMIEGLQGAPGTPEFLDQHHVVATAKHFLGDGGTDRGVDQGDNLSTEQQMIDVHLPGYRGAMAAGVQAVMASYNSWHGAKMHGQEELLTGVLRGRMGFDGLVVGDWNGHGQLPGCTNDSCAAAINAGVDMFMVPEDWKALWENTVAQAKSGEIPAERLDQAVRRILRVKMRAGLFEAPKPSERALGGRFELLGSAEHRAVARRAVRGSLVLLKNDPVGGAAADGARALPIAPGASVLVAGDGADDVGKQSGGWTLSWQGTENDNDDFPGATSIWAGLRDAVEAAGGTATLSVAGDFDAAAPPDVAVVVFGEDPYAEFQGDRPSVLYHDAGDLALVRSFHDAGVPVVAVFLSGRPMWVNPYLNVADAFVAAWLPGTEGGGVADVLVAGEDGAPRHDFTGRLSFSWPRLPTQNVLNAVPAGARSEGYDPLFPLGYGLSYAAAGDLPELPVEVEGSEPPAGQVYFAADPGDAAAAEAAPWSWSAPPAGGGVTMSRIDSGDHAGARSITWSGESAAPGGHEVRLAGDEAMDLSRESNGNLALALEMRQHAAPSAPVMLGVGCGEGCAGSVDVSAWMAQAPVGEWGSLRVRLSCFADAGADVSAVVDPVVLSSQGPLQVDVARVELLPPHAGLPDCP